MELFHATAYLLAVAHLLSMTFLTFLAFRWVAARLSTHIYSLARESFFTLVPYHRWRDNHSSGGVRRRTSGPWV